MCTTNAIVVVVVVVVIYYIIILLLLMMALSVSVGDYEACLTRLRHVKKIPSLNELYFALSVCQLQPISKFVPGLIAKSSAPVLYNRNMYWQQKNQELISHCTGNETFQ